MSTSFEQKNITLEAFSLQREQLRQSKKKVVNCHGVFDLLHPGHIFHLEEAKRLGDVLVVSITAAMYVNKGPGRPYFNDELRLRSLAALACVDYVILSEHTTAHAVIEGIQPDFYVKGAEYAASQNDITGNIDDEVAYVRSFGGDVYFTTGEVFSSTKLINNHLGAIPENAKEFLLSLIGKYDVSYMRELVDRFETKNILVIGDIIIDDYAFCKVQGLMSKDYGFSTRYEKEERYFGGSLAIARHLSNFSKEVTMMAMMGDEPNLHRELTEALEGQMTFDLLQEETYETVIKKRYLARKGIRSEYDKLFSINYLDGERNAKAEKTVFYEKLKNTIEAYDMVVLCDFGHGLIDSTVMEIVQDKARFLSLNCQTNSSNYGTNLITKYHRADSFTLDEKELRLACSNNIDTPQTLLKNLNTHFNSTIGCLTLGSEGACTIDSNNKLMMCPAFTLNVKDTVGAGDAFFSIASLCALVEAPPEVTVFLSNIAGAIASNIMGNSRGIEKVELLKTAATLLNI